MTNLLGKLIKNDFNNLYLLPKYFKIILIQNSYLTSTFCRNPASSSNQNFSNINLTKTMAKITERGCNNLYLIHKVFHRSSKWNSYLMSVSRRRQVNLPTPIFDNINLTETITKFTCCLEIQSKMVGIISIFNLNSLKLLQIQIHVWCQFHVVVP